MKRKTIIVIVFMAILTAPLRAQTETNFQVTLTGDGQGVIITGYTGTVMAVRIPATIEGMPVREIGAHAFVHLRITGVVIPAGVTVIRNMAFAGSWLLTSVTLPNTLTHIEASAFLSTALTSITLPNSLTYIGGGAFSGTALTSVAWPARVTSISDYMFSDCISLRTVVIPEGVTSIEEQAFHRTALTGLTLPSTISSIGNRAFAGIQTLTDVTIPATVESINFGRAVFNWPGSLNLASQAALRRVGFDPGIHSAW